MVAIKAAVKIGHNQPDLVIWEVEKKICHIIEFKRPTEGNLTKNTLGSVPKDMHENIRQLGFNKKESIDIIKAIQQRVIICTVKICKTFLNFKK